MGISRVGRSTLGACQRSTLKALKAGRPNLVLCDITNNRFVYINEADFSIDSTVNFPSLSGTVSGVGYDGVNLFIGEWFAPTNHSAFKIHILDLDGNIVSSFNAPDPLTGGGDHATQIAGVGCDMGGTNLYLMSFVYVGTAVQNIYTLDRSGSVLNSQIPFPTSNAGLGLFSNPNGAGGDLYCIKYNNVSNHVIKLNASTYGIVATGGGTATARLGGISGTASKLYRYKNTNQVIEERNPSTLALIRTSSSFGFNCDGLGGGF